MPPTLAHLALTIVAMLMLASGPLQAEEGAKPTPAKSESPTTATQTKAQEAPKPAQIKAEELRIRGGLPNFFSKATRGVPLTVAYFGGSITAHNGWRVHTFEWLKKQYPSVKLTMVNASVGGTGSIIGAFRADNDLVKHKPDLVFIEFAVNDGGDGVRQPDNLKRAIEGIILKVLKVNPEADFCFVYTLQDGMLPDWQKGLFPPAASAHDLVAEHYGFPAIGLGVEVAKLVQEGKWVMSGKVAQDGKDANGKMVFTEDKTHPTIPGGHALYGETVERCLEKMKSEGKPGPRKPSAPLMSDNWQNAKTIPAAGNVTLVGKWEKIIAKGGKADQWPVPDSVSSVWRTESPGATLSLKFKGTMVGIKGFEGPDSGIVSIQIDDKPATKQCLFTVYSTGRRYVGSPLPALPAGEHTITWTLLNEKPDKHKILNGKPNNDKDFIAHPDIYAPTRFSAAEIILLGEILPPPPSSAK